MSGTSLDGLDICFASFTKLDGKWSYVIEKALSQEYPAEIKQKLATAQDMSSYEYALFNSDYGLYLGRQVKDFIKKFNLKPHYIASHGHTIFHRPSLRFTAQIGSGAGIAAASGVDTICDFRTTDVALGGQGAPLVPVGDRNLFGDYDYCLNLGGFSNISSEKGHLRSAYDISPVNYVLNHYASKAGFDYDKDGQMAESGKVNWELFDALNSLSYYREKGPKSLGREWVEEVVYPLIDSYLPQNAINDKLASFCEHVAYQIGRNVEKGKVLVTGGGAFNKYLIKRMEALAPQCNFEVPDHLTVNFKEALIFAFLGALYVSGEPNSLASVTGAEYSCIGGALYRATTGVLPY